ncbi:Nicotinamide riboside transporter PnuC [Lacunisphaera limnophila]|uniref:Nicotinamide riboside transporter PnuC n=1 Tax=Lacunisphaera limnophila TaxID=1838286 RepID=A0A1D8ARE2_9BACT|nr:nicotinamide riboside transporter PnuC [Lacunisphaera limnophila]AOS43463.1 Nicotinamide riboside transporter PnuC [Lacunisphaera limnophila]
MSPAEIIGTVLGVIGVALMIRQNIWGWPVGLVQVAVYAWVFYGAKLYSDVILQGCFFVIQGYGWWHWVRGDGARANSPASDQRGEVAAPPSLPVTRLSAAGMLSGLGLGAVATAGWGAYMHRTTDAALPYWDAGILVFSLIAQGLQARKKLENWALWLGVNTVAIGVYWAKDLRLTAGLYVIFWAMALWGWREWRRAAGGPAATGPT